jgi:hypothetical protein
MNGNGLDLHIQSERLDRVEKTANELAISVAAQRVEIGALNTQMKLGHDHIVEKLDVISGNLSNKLGEVSQNLEKVAQKEENNEKRLDSIEIKGKVYTKLKKGFMNIVLALFSGAGALLVEQLIRHRGQ